MILITGASGFVGRNLVQALADHVDAASIRLFDIQPATGAGAASGEFVSGAIEDPESVAKAMRDVDVVIHLAAMVQPASRAVDDMRRINVDGARNVYDAAVREGCRLFVHMSSAGVYGHPRKPEPWRETDPKEPETPYQRTKHEAEVALLGAARQSTTLNIIRPAGIYGPGSLLEIPAYRRIQRQRFSVEMKGGVMVHPTHVSDVTGAIMALVDQPAPHGAIFNVGGETPVLLGDFFALVADALGVTRQRVSLPPVVAAAIVAVAAPVLAKIGRRNPHLRGFSRGALVSASVDDRAFRERYPSVPVYPLRRGVREHIAWARAQGRL